MNIDGARRGLALLGALLLTSGCYRYTPTDASLVPPGDDVRVLVTRLGAAQLDEVVVERSMGGAISGVMNGLEGDDLLMRVPVGARRDGFMMVDMMQTIRVPMGEVLGVERRELDKVGTGFIVAGAVALGIGVVVGIMEAFGTTTPPGEPPPEDFSVMLGTFLTPWGR